MGIRLRKMWLVVAVPALSGCVVATSSTGSGSGGALLFLAAPFVFFVLIALLIRGLVGGGRHRIRRSGRSAGAGGVNREVLRAELSVLADDVIRLEPQVALHEAARDDFEAATHRYRVAQAAIDRVTEPTDLVRLQRVVDEASWSMSRARAILEGRPPPSPPGRLLRPGPHGEPAVDVDEGQRPVYVDSPVSFHSGWFAGGGLLGGLLLGGFGASWSDDDGSDDADRWDDAADDAGW